MPYGMQHAVAGAPITEADYKYTGKEQQTAFGLDNLYDSQARFQYVTDGSFMSHDPLSATFSDTSPYMYCGGDPINRVDQDGKEWYLYQEEYIDENGVKRVRDKYKFVDGRLSESEIKNGGYQYIGMTYLSDNAYYSLKGSKITFDTDDLFSIQNAGHKIFSDLCKITFYNTRDNYGDEINFTHKAMSIFNNITDLPSYISKPIKIIDNINNAKTLIVEYKNITNNELKGVDALDSLVNLISIAGIYGTAASLYYDGAKKAANYIEEFEMDLRAKVRQWVGCFWAF